MTQAADDGAQPEQPDSSAELSPGVVDLLGVLAYGELSAFDRMAADARYSPTWEAGSRCPRWPPPRWATSRPWRGI